jgi:hypothetical protein
MEPPSFDEQAAGAIVAPIADPLSRISQELHELTVVAKGLQSNVSRLAVLIPHDGREHLLPLQNLDVLTQSLSAIADFSRELASTSSPSWMLDLGPALHVVTMSDLASRLSPVPTRNQPADVASRGDCEFF